MTTRRANYLLDAPLVDTVARDVGAIIGLPLELQGEDVSGAGTATIYTPSKEILQAGAVTIVDDEAQIELLPATLVDADLSMDYEIQWSLTIDGVVSEYRTRLAIVLFAPVCPLTEAALTKLRPTLKARVLRGTGRTSLQEWIEVGWDEVQRHLLSGGNRPELVVDISELYKLTRAITLYEIYSDAALGTDSDGSLRVEADRWGAEAAALKSSLELTYDTDEDGTANELRSAQGSMWLCASGSMQGAV